MILSYANNESFLFPIAKVFLSVVLSFVVPRTQNFWSEILNSVALKHFPSVNCFHIAVIRFCFLSQDCW